jgi:hypothetical protein
MVLADVYNDFNQKCATATSLVSISNVFFDNQVNFNTDYYSPDIHFCVINGAFLMLFMAFERFLEQSFVCYMLGQSGINNNVVECFVRPTSEDHALDILRGIKPYPDFTNRDIIVKLAKNFFQEGGTYQSLNEFAPIFEEIKKIRNAITHTSIESEKNFLSFARVKLGAVPSNLNTAIFLNTIESHSNISYFVYYRDHIKSVVDKIANPI